MSSSTPSGNGGKPAVPMATTTSAAVTSLFPNSTPTASKSIIITTSNSATGHSSSTPSTPTLLTSTSSMSPGICTVVQAAGTAGGAIPITASPFSGAINLTISNGAINLKQGAQQPQMAQMHMQPKLKTNIAGAQAQTLQKIPIVQQGVAGNLVRGQINLRLAGPLARPGTVQGTLQPGTLISPRTMMIGSTQIRGGQNSFMLGSGTLILPNPNNMKVTGGQAIIQGAGNMTANVAPGSKMANIRAGGVPILGNLGKSIAISTTTGTIVSTTGSMGAPMTFTSLPVSSLPLATQQQIQQQNPKQMPQSIYVANTMAKYDGKNLMVMSCPDAVVAEKKMPEVKTNVEKKAFKKRKASQEESDDAKRRKKDEQSLTKTDGAGTSGISDNKQDSNKDKYKIIAVQKKPVEKKDGEKKIAPKPKQLAEKKVIPTSESSVGKNTPTKLAVQGITPKPTPEKVLSTSTPSTTPSKNPTNTPSKSTDAKDSNPKPDVEKVKSSLEKSAAKKDDEKAVKEKAPEAEEKMISVEEMMRKEDSLMACLDGGEESADTNADFSETLDWHDGIGTLPGSDMKFRKNDLGILEMVLDDNLDNNLMCTEDMLPAEMMATTEKTPLPSTPATLSSTSSPKPEEVTEEKLKEEKVQAKEEKVQAKEENVQAKEEKVQAKEENVPSKEEKVQAEGEKEKPAKKEKSPAKEVMTEKMDVDYYKNGSLMNALVARADDNDKKSGTIIRCQNCRTYGMASEFYHPKGKLCNRSCAASFASKKAMGAKKASLPAAAATIPPPAKDATQESLSSAASTSSQSSTASSASSASTISEAAKAEKRRSRSKSGEALTRKKRKSDDSSPLKVKDEPKSDDNEQLPASQPQSRCVSRMGSDEEEENLDGMSTCSSIESQQRMKTETAVVAAAASSTGTAAAGRKQRGWTWTNYLEKEKAQRMPVKMFKEFQQIPTQKNNFKVGMKLEGIDPLHPSMYCVMTVVEVKGFRLRLRFDGYQECHDFWLNANSPFIFPPGWAEKNSKKLEPPKGCTEPFNWSSYLKEMKSPAAPKNLFTNTSVASVTPHGFRVGMKLEAIDKKDTALTCVATVADVLGDKLLIHFDGWEDSYDYWSDPTSPYIHPVGWCQENGKPLSPPNDWNDIPGFTWDKYLHYTKSLVVPSRAFKTRCAPSCEPGMKLECVDRRNQVLIRVATVADVNGQSLKIHYDGWGSQYDVWMDDDDPDLHPTNWCSRTGHPLETPPTERTSAYNNQDSHCPTPGCRGIGHIKGAKYTGHHSAYGCPYSAANMSKEDVIPDRLGNKRSQETLDFNRMDTNEDSRDLAACNNGGDMRGAATSSRGGSFTTITQQQTQSVVNLAKESARLPPATADLAEHLRQLNNGRPLIGPGSGRGRKKNKVLKLLQEAEQKENTENNGVRSSTPSLNTTSPPTSKLHRQIHDSIFASEKPFPLPVKELSVNWDFHSKILTEETGLCHNDVKEWNTEQVGEFVVRITGCGEQITKKFLAEEIDGESLLMLPQEELVNTLGLKLGPALKVFNTILVIKRNNTEY